MFVILKNLIEFSAYIKQLLIIRQLVKMQVVLHYQPVIYNKKRFGTLTMRKIFLFAFSLAFFLPNISVAQEEMACVQYQRKDFSWGSVYTVPAIVVEGDQLNEIAKTTKYKNYNNYAVVLWGNGGYSAIELPAYQDDLPYSYREGRAQDGTKYKIKKAPSYGRCTSY